MCIFVCLWSSTRRHTRHVESDPLVDFASAAMGCANSKKKDEFEPTPHASASSSPAAASPEKAEEAAPTTEAAIDIKVAEPATAPAAAPAAMPTAATPAATTPTPPAPPPAAAPPPAPPPAAAPPPVQPGASGKEAWGAAEPQESRRARRAARLARDLNHALRASINLTRKSSTDKIMKSPTLRRSDRDR